MLSRLTDGYLLLFFFHLFIIFLLSTQIRDWLTVLETMLKQQVAIVGDSDDVLQLLEKQKVLTVSRQCLEDFLAFYWPTLVTPP